MSQFVLNGITENGGSIFDSILTQQSFDVAHCLLCIVAGLFCGLLLAITYLKTEKRCSKNMAAALVILPAISSVVIMAVNDSLGVGIAIAGAFSLVRFRSQLGNAKEMTVLFSTLALGLLTGSGYILFALVFTAIIVLVLVLMALTNFGGQRDNEKILRIDIPEDLDYEGVFDGILSKYAVNYTLDSVKTTNMGSMFELKYSVYMKKNASEKDLIDEIRTRNANLPVLLNARKPGESDL